MSGPGTALCVFRDGRPAEIGYQGTRCHAGGPITEGPITEGTVWEAASPTKPIVAGYVLELSADGALDLDAPLVIDPGAIGAPPDPRWASLTARHVLTHTSGLPNWRGPIASLRAAGWDVDAGDEQLQFENDPGRFGYSGEAFEVLLHALCRARGIGPTEVLEPVLSPLGMAQSSFVWQPGFEERAAIPHSSAGEPLPKARPPLARAAGSLHTTLPDYIDFASRVLHAGSDDVFEPAVALDASRGRSLGWGTLASADGIVAWQHGDNPGFKHIVALRRDVGDGVVMFTNGDDGLAVHRAVCRRVLGIDSW